MEVFQHPPIQNEQDSGALVVNRTGGTIDSFDFDHNVAIGVPKIIDNQGHLGPARIHDNMIDNTALAIPQETKCQSRPQTQAASPDSEQLPTDNKVTPRSNPTSVKMEYNVFLEPPKDTAPLHVSSGPVGRNYDGTFNSYFDVQMDKNVECDYLIVAIGAPGLINFWVVQDRSLVGIDQVPIAGFIIKRITNPRGALTFVVRHKDAVVRLDVKTWWKWTRAPQPQTIYGLERRGVVCAREASPTAAIIDSQSLKAAEKGERDEADPVLALP
jgi:hypothetical protein